MAVTTLFRSFMLFVVATSAEALMRCLRDVGWRGVVAALRDLRLKSTDQQVLITATKLL
jgi:hypothetical protein